jgi:hypothetical protein
MMPLHYHSGQIEAQTEANTRHVAEMLAHWVGPVAEFASVADLIVLAVPDSAGDLRFACVSGAAPLLQVAGPGSLRFDDLALPSGSDEFSAGGLAINLAQLRRARINGSLHFDGAGWVLEAEEAFTNCRKYMAPSMAVDTDARSRPSASSQVALDDPWLADVISRAETSFLASVSPDGRPDVSHRGGEPGFLTWDPAAARMTWPEFVGDGMFKSAGNVRATGTASLLVLDLQTGDAAELIGHGRYTTLRTSKQARVDALEHHRERFPVQGEIELDVRRAYRHTRLVTARHRLEKAVRITSSSSPDDQAPQ